MVPRLPPPAFPSWAPAVRPAARFGDPGTRFARADTAANAPAAPFLCVPAANRRLPLGGRGAGTATGRRFHACQGYQRDLRHRQRRARRRHPGRRPGHPAQGDRPEVRHEDGASGRRDGESALPPSPRPLPPAIPRSNPLVFYRPGAGRAKPSAGPRSVGLARACSETPRPRVHSDPATSAGIMYTYRSCPIVQGFRANLRLSFGWHRHHRIARLGLCEGVVVGGSGAR